MRLARAGLWERFGGRRLYSARGGRACTKVCDMEIGRGSHNKKVVCDGIIVYVLVFRLALQMLNHFELFSAAGNEKNDGIVSRLTPVA